MARGLVVHHQPVSMCYNSERNFKREEYTLVSLTRMAVKVSI